MTIKFVNVLNDEGKDNNKDDDHKQKSKNMFGKTIYIYRNIQKKYRKYDNLIEKYTEQ